MYYFHLLNEAFIYKMSKKGTIEPSTVYVKPRWSYKRTIQQFCKKIFILDTKELGAYCDNWMQHKQGHASHLSISLIMTQCEINSCVKTGNIMWLCASISNCVKAKRNVKIKVNVIDWKFEPLRTGHFISLTITQSLSVYNELDLLKT